MPGQMPRVYNGDRDYVFVDYAHADQDSVMPIVGRLVSEGYRVWYDDGIEPATDYSEYLADHVYGCACLIMFVSSSSVASEWCRQEVTYALDLHKKILPIYLEDVELTRGLQMRTGGKQALYWYLLEEEEFYQKLFQTHRLDSCLTSEGKARRGVKPKVAEVATVAGGATAGVDPVPGLTGSVSVDYGGVKKRGVLADYSWAELKALSRAIAVAGSDAGGLEIARAYGLVDKDGRLRGDTKSLTLKDGTESSVRILGFRHDELANGGKAGISFEFADVPTRRRMNPSRTNTGGWEKNAMRSWLNFYFFAFLPDDLRQHVSRAKKLTNNQGMIDENNLSAVTVTADKLWLLSTCEVYGKTMPIYDAEGVQYQLFADKGVSTDNYGFCGKCGADSGWWLRSPGAYDPDAFLRVGGEGLWNLSYANIELGVSPGLCF